jgi:disulfide oxidoreductase YuzD
MKTAVEWLYNNLKSHFEHDGDLLEVVQFSFEQAKEMEKQQIIDAYKNGKYESDKIVMSDRFYAEQYYNEQFKNK